MADQFSSRSSVGGNPAQYLDAASELFNRRAQQGKGKVITDKASFGTAGNPKAFMDMARNIRSTANTRMD